MYIKNKHAIIVISILSLIIIMEAFYLWCLPRIVSSSKSVALIEKIFKEKTTADLRIDNLKFDTYGDFSFGLSADKLVISTKSGKEIIDADKVILKTYIFPLLFKNIDIKSIKADSIELDAQRYKDGRYNFEDLLFKSNKKIFRVKMKNTRFNLSKYNIHFRDDLLDKNIRIKGSYFKIASFTMDKGIDIDTQGVLTAPGVNTEYQVRIYSNLPLKEHIDDSKFVVSGFVSDFEPSYFTPYLKKYLKNDTQDISGNLSLDFYTKKPNTNNKEICLEGVANDFLVNTKRPEDRILFKGKNVISLKFKLNRNKLELVNASLNADRVKFVARGSIKKYKSDKPSFDLNVILGTSRLEDIVSLLPSNLIPRREEIKKIKKYGARGDIKANIFIKGKVPEPNILGYVDGDNVHILSGLDSKHEGTIRLVFDKRVLKAKVFFKTPNNQNIKVDTTTYMYKDKQNINDVVSTSNLDLKLVQTLLLPIRDVFEFQLGPLPSMKLSGGTGSTNLHIVGTRKSAEVKGFVKFNNGRMSYNGINADFYGINGSVDFLGKLVKYKTDRAFVKNTPIALTGSSVINDVAHIKIATASVDSAILWKVVKSSPLLQEISSKLVVIDKISGLTSFELNIDAKIADMASISPKDLLKDMQVTGNLVFKKATCYLKDYNVPLKNIKGRVDFTQTTTKFSDLKGTVGSSQVKVFGDIVNNLKTNIPSINISVIGDKVRLVDSLSFITDCDTPNKLDLKGFKPSDFDAFHNLTFNYISDSAVAEKIDLNAISFTAKFLPQKTQSLKPIQVNSGILTMNKGDLKVENISSKIYDTAVNIAGNVEDAASLKPIYNLSIDTAKFNLAAINDAVKTGFLSKNIMKFVSQYSDFSGTASLHLKINKNKPQGSIAINNTKFVHKVSGVPVSIDAANFELEPDKIMVKSLSAMIGSAPLFAEFELSDFAKNPLIKGYITTKLTDDFMDNYINNNLTYPVKVKGDISLIADISGTKDNLKVSPKIKLNEGADITYLSSNIGDIRDDREIDGDFIVSPNKILIQRFEYLKYMQSQNGKTYPMSYALVKGTLSKIKNKYVAESLLLKTNNPMPARLLNFAFKKSILKQGTFNCSLFYKLNTSSNVPKVFGNIDFNDIDIPLYDTVIKDVAVKSRKGIIDLDAKGTVFSSDFSISSQIENKLLFPINVKKLDIVSEEFNFDKLLNSLGDISLETYQDKTTKTPVPFDVSKVTVQDGHLLAENLIFRTLSGAKLSSDFTIDGNSNLKLSSIDIKVADGELKGSGLYNLKTTQMETDLVAQKVDSAAMAEALFDMKNQIYGDLNGQLYIRTKGSNRDERMKNLSGLVYFNITDGRMPKLGSLEYLLRASNLVKSGVTGLTINSIIDIVNPIRTGHFSSINGNFMIDDGVAKNIEIFSKGENLSIYVKGTYDIVNSKADMRVLGKLAKKIPTLLGPIGNTSINSFFNVIPGMILSESDKVKYLKEVLKIPGLDFNNDDYRVFQAEINGNINGNNYVSSFKWVE